MEFTGTLRAFAQAAAVTACAAAALAVTAPGASAATYYNVHNANTGTCLDSNTAGDVYTLNCNGNDNQRWHIAGGKFTDKATGWCLSSDGVSVKTQRCLAIPAQQWTTTPDAKKWIEWNHSGKCLHSSGASGEHVGLRACGAGSSRWTFTAS